MAAAGVFERVPFPDLSLVPGLRVATGADLGALCRIDARANRWAWRHGTAARARACLAAAVLALAVAGLGVFGGEPALAIMVIGVIGAGIPVVYAATLWDIRSGIRRTLRRSRSIVILSDDQTAFLTIVRTSSRGMPCWVVGRHAAIRVGEGHGARLRACVWGPLIAQADAQAISIAALVPVRLEQRLLDEVPGARRTCRLPFARQVERSPIAQPS